MKILGNGVDIVENKRINKLVNNKNFIDRVFTVSEIYHSKRKKDKSSFFAKRFAAKEAFVKALGTGFRDNINFKDISIRNNSYGKPEFVLKSSIKNKLKKKFKIKKYNVFLSISDEKKYSIAFAILAGK
tara:strand:- start:56 stop:442 length:387 start_codon:yes stop_codon:yes gene_type:complete